MNESDDELATAEERGLQVSEELFQDEADADDE
jgi:hypothetical protein